MPPCNRPSSIISTKNGHACCTFSKVIHVWDTALAITETGSETACTTFGKAMNGKVWWLDA